MAITLKNYTTEVPASKSQAMITQLLIDFGARDIATSFNDSGRLIAIRFIVEISGDRLPFSLPVDVTAVYIWLKKQRKTTTTAAQEKKLLEQAERVAWKNCYEWTYQQLVQIELGQMEKLEALLYRYYDQTTGQTYFQKLKSTNFTALLEAPKNEPK